MASGTFTRVDVIRTHLELRGRDALRPSAVPALAATLVRLRPIAAQDYRALYTLVGERWFWRDRLVWSDAELEAHLSSPTVYVWRLDVGDQIAGYFELQQQANGAVEVLYFGLVPAFMGRGLGGWLLTRAAEEAFALGAQRVVLNTCTLDAPQALPNYLARGFTIVREERYVLDLPDASASAAMAPRG
jgi:ribosomal protein S18 acetylase RimI-like enzyme